MPFDQSKADRVCNFFEEILKHTKGSEFGGKPFMLLPYQEQGLSHVFGTVDEEGYRTVRTWYDELPKKTGKSESAAGIALYVLDQDGEPGCEVYSAASNRKQARNVFDVAAAMVRASKYLSRKYKIVPSTATIVNRRDPTCFYRAISCDGDSNDGINPQCVIIDELHRWRGRKAEELWAIIRASGQIARRQPLTVIITTAGEPGESPLCWQEHEYVQKQIEGVIEPNPHYYGRIFAASEEDDPGDPATWAKAIPSLDQNGGFLRTEAIRQIYEEAKSKGEKELADFCRFHLNIWTHGNRRYIPPAVWKLGAGETRALVERRCFAGLDLSMKTDLTALVLLFPDDDGSVDWLPFFWMPEDTVREREIKDKMPYRQWVKQGLIQAVPGNVIDYGPVKDKLRWANEMFDLQEVAYDKWNAQQLAIEMQEEGFKMIPCPQNFATLSEPTKALKEWSLQGRFRHGDHAVLRWNIDCMTVKPDGHDNIKPVKPNRATDNKRIDGAVAGVMALWRILLQPQPVNIDAFLNDPIRA